MSYSKKLLCPCGSNNHNKQQTLFAQCCARFIVDATLPQHAVELMRSRYSAYVLGIENYLQSTWHPSTRPASPIIDQQDAIKWIKLVVLQHQQSDAKNSDNATVEFVAHYKIQGRAHKLHEISRFVREGGRWFYVNGTFPGEQST